MLSANTSVLYRSLAERTNERRSHFEHSLQEHSAVEW